MTEIVRDAMQTALQALANGQIVVVADEGNREDEGDLVTAAGSISTEQMAFYLKHGSGIVCAPMDDSTADSLGLPLMVADNTDNHQTAFTVSVDHVSVGTGISASDRAITMRALADPSTHPEELRRPGHVFPLRARPGGVLKRAGHTEAAMDLLALAGVAGPAVITELMGDDGEPLKGAQIEKFAVQHGLAFMRVADLVRARRSATKLVVRTGEALLPLAEGNFLAVSFTSVLDQVEHLALVHGNIAAADVSSGGVLVRVHSECLTGDVFGSRRCDCGDQLRQALELIAAEGVGIVIYLRGHEGRGIGLAHKLQAYALQERGYDTIDANLALGLPIDSREYGIGANMLADIGVRRLRLITNNPHKYVGLAGYDIELIDRVTLPSATTPDNIAYLRTKRDRMGHRLDLPS